MMSGSYPPCRRGKRLDLWLLWPVLVQNADQPRTIAQLLIAPAVHRPPSHLQWITPRTDDQTHSSSSHSAMACPTKSWVPVSKPNFL